MITVSEQREMETINKNQVDILELKIAISEITKEKGLVGLT